MALGLISAVVMVTTGVLVSSSTEDRLTFLGVGVETTTAQVFVTGAILAWVFIVALWLLRVGMHRSGARCAELAGRWAGFGRGGRAGADEPGLRAAEGEAVVDVAGSRWVRGLSLVRIDVTRLSWGEWGGAKGQAAVRGKGLAGVGRLSAVDGPAGRSGPSSGERLAGVSGPSSGERLAGHVEPVGVGGVTGAGELGGVGGLASIEGLRGVDGGIVGRSGAAADGGGAPWRRLGGRDGADRVRAAAGDKDRAVVLDRTFGPGAGAVSAAAAAIGVRVRRRGQRPQVGRHPGTVAGQDGRADGEQREGVGGE